MKTSRWCHRHVLGGRMKKGGRRDTIGEHSHTAATLTSHQLAMVHSRQPPISIAFWSLCQKYLSDSQKNTTPLATLERDAISNDERIETVL